MSSSAPHPGQWTVILEPLPRKDDRIPSQELAERVDGAAVALRGWNYPHLERPFRALDGGYESRTDARPYHEQCRFFTSGLFIHQWKIREDEWDGYEGQLDFINALWSITEVWIFARRMYAEDSTVESVTVTITLDGLLGRRLSGPPRYSFGITATPSTDDVFKRATRVKRAELVVDGEQIAVDWAGALFHQMGAPGLSSQVLREHQLRLIQRRFD